MAEGRLDYNIRDLWESEELNVIGPTADSNFRTTSDLPHPSAGTDPNDAQTIFLDPVGGDDADSGFTFSLAKKSFDAAWNACTAARPYLHIRLSTGVDVEMVVALGTEQVNTDVLSIQVHQNQNATLKLMGGTQYRGNSSCVAHNLTIYSEGNLYQSRSLVVNRYEWCHHIHYNIKATDISFVGYDFESEVSIFERRPDTEPFETSTVIPVPPTGSIVGRVGTGDDCTLLRCIVIDKSPVQTTVVDGNASLDIQHCAIINANNVIGAGLSSVVFTDNIVHRCVHMVDPTHVAAPYAVSRNLLSVRHTDNITVDGSNVLRQDPLFLDEFNDDYRLAHVAWYRTTNQSDAAISFPVGRLRFQKNSPAVGIGDGGSDAGPHIVTHTWDQEYADSLTFPENMGWEAIDSNKTRTAYQKYDTLRGNARQSFDALQFDVKLKLSGKYYTPENFAEHLSEIAGSRTDMRFHPNGDDPVAPDTTRTGDVMLFAVSSGFHGGVWDGVPFELVVLYSAADFDPDGGVLRPDFFKGWIARVVGQQTSTATDLEGYYEIVHHYNADFGGNPFIWFYLKHKRGDDISLFGLPGDVGQRELYVQYLPCLYDTQRVNLISEYARERETTGRVKPFWKGKTYAKFHTREIPLVQAEAQDQQFQTQIPE